jgi:hypothetical protein
MALRTLLTWNNFAEPSLAGYTVVPSTGGSYTTTVAMWLDPTIYDDQAAADEVTYSISRLETTLGPVIDSDYPDPTTPSFRIARWSVPSDVRLCRVYGNVLNLAGFVNLRPELRFFPYLRDIPLRRTDFAFMMTEDVAIYTNCLGEFEVWLTSGLPMVLHMPEASFAARFVVPDAVSADVRTLTLDPIPQYRNN